MKGEMMGMYYIQEEGNGSWCDLVEATDSDAVWEIVMRELADCHPADYQPDFSEGDPMPRVKVTLREVGRDETYTRELTVGEMQ